MEIIVQKYGGTSVNDPQCRMKIAENAKSVINEGFHPVIVVSAMGRYPCPYATDTLLSLVGILFCNMLIICSFGLQESIPRFVNQYFQETLRYNVRADLKSGQAGTLASYRARLKADTVDGIMEKMGLLDMRAKNSGKGVLSVRGIR